ncbi:hypothetical protein NQZ68_016279 [Dissostichus eleginoides]|nr:hypothetical protein NQZ68_016279 [Dissostichus eleginoides]
MGVGRGDLKPSVSLFSYSSVLGSTSSPQPRGGTQMSILYRWCKSMSSHGPKPESFDVCQHRQNQSRSPKTIRQQSQRITVPTLFPHLNQQ